MSFPAIVVLGLALLLALIMLESRRQVRKYGKGRGTGANLARAGLMEVQSLLEPERKIEVLRDAERKQDLLVQLDDDGGPPSSGRRPGRSMKLEE